MSNLRIALVGPLPPPEGGMANQTQQLSKLLGSESYDVRIVQTNLPYIPRWIGRYRGVRALFRLCRYLRRLWSVIGKSQICHVMANSGMSWHLFVAPAVWVAYLRRVPIIINYRGGEADKFFEKSFRWVKPTLGRATVVVVPSGYLAEIFKKWGINTQVVPNIINLDLFQPRPISCPDEKLEQPHILVARNLEPIYGIDVALYAFSNLLDHLDDARLTIAGSGPQQSELRALAGKLGIAEKVIFVGRMRNDEMAALYQRVDILLNASLVDNMPISLLEAMASGIPIVSSAAGGIPYLVKQDKTALLVKPGDSAAMSDALVRIINNGALRNRLVRNGLQEIRRYSWPSVRDRLLEIYHNVAALGN